MRNNMGAVVALINARADIDIKCGGEKVLPIVQSVCKGGSWNGLSCFEVRLLLG